MPAGPDRGMPQSRGSRPRCRPGAGPRRAGGFRGARFGLALGHGVGRGHWSRHCGRSRAGHFGKRAGSRHFLETRFLGISSSFGALDLVQFKEARGGAVGEDEHRVGCGALGKDNGLMTPAARHVGGSTAGSAAAPGRARALTHQKRESNSDTPRCAARTRSHFPAIRNRLLTIFKPSVLTAWPKAAVSGGGPGALH
jgi:hypothetical protein